jgi:hypothetical protein
MTAKPDKAKAGQKKIPLKTWNRLCDMLGQHEQRDALGSGGGPLQMPREQDTIRVKNESGGALAKWSVVRVEEYLLDAVNRTRLFFKGSKVSRGNQMIAAIQWTAAENEIVEAQIAGVGLALVDVGATWHRRAYPTKDATVLTSGLFGPVEILGELTTTGEQACVCRFGHSSNRMVYAVVATGGITAATYASSDLTMGTGTATLFEPHATTAAKWTLTSGGTIQEVTAKNMALGAIDAGKVVALAPGDDWLPTVIIESCE